MRAACEFLGRLTSLQIAALEDRELLALRASRRATEDALARAMRESAATESVLAALLAHPKELMGLVGAEGAAWVSTGEPVTCGRTPPPALIQEIAAWVEEREAFRPFSTDVARGHVPSGASSQRRRQRAAHVRSARRSPEATSVVPPRDHQDGELGWRSNQARRGRFRRAPAPPPFVCALARGGETPLASVDGERSRGRRRAAAARHRSRPRAAALERAAGGAGAGRRDRRRVPRPQEPAVGHPVAS